MADYTQSMICIRELDYLADVFAPLKETPLAPQTSAASVVPNNGLLLERCGRYTLQLQRRLPANDPVKWNNGEPMPSWSRAGRQKAEQNWFDNLHLSFNWMGFNQIGYNRHGNMPNEYDCYGYDVRGYDVEGFNWYGFNRYGIPRNNYDRNMYDVHGFDCCGYNREGFNSLGHKRSMFGELCSFNYKRRYNEDLSMEALYKNFKTGPYTKDYLRKYNKEFLEELEKSQKYIHDHSMYKYF
nr:uncharacterized protein LOC123763816 [Procambarus clarkii]XP_045607089.1 uncharacterized protein LOC123763816 [Procambarus clarkii]